MLHPKQNRIDYGEQLIPPEGYELEFAVGTSYSLDLEALMMLPVALFYAKKIEGNPEQLRYDMLDSITKAADKIKIYFQNGQLKVPGKYHPLMAYWEKGIIPVTMPEYVQSFHPKVWVIRYESKSKNPIYRLLVTSRNLTFSRDWDVAFATEGKLTTTEQSTNKPLVHFLLYLNKQSKQIPEKFISDLFKVEFEVPDKFKELEFLPVGMQNPETGRIYSNPLTQDDSRWTDMLIISPFIDKITLEKLRKNVKNQPVLCSRSEELDTVIPETLEKFNCFEFNSFFTKAEFLQSIEEEGVIPRIQNLHAKLYITMQRTLPFWFLGSANCSAPAQQRNIEFLVKLHGTYSYGIKANDILELLTHKEKNDAVPIFTPYKGLTQQREPEYKKYDDEVRKLKHRLSLIPITGNVNLIEGGTKYNLTISLNCRDLFIPEEFSVAIKPLPEEQKKAVYLTEGKENVIESFGGYAETRLSPFLITCIYHNDIVLSEFLLPMEISLPKSRFNRIFSAIIDSREKFLRYLAFLLTGEETGLVGETERDINLKKLNGNNILNFVSGAVYEKLLIASSRYPSRLKSVDNLIQRLISETSELKEPIITSDFETFWKTFQHFIRNKK
jgi:hypothetical protein